MTFIPKSALKPGEQVSEAAAKAVQNIKNGIRREVIPGDKLVRQPSSDLYDIATDMNNPRFWADEHNQRMWRLGQRIDPNFYAAEIPQHYAKAVKICEPLKDYVDKMRRLAHRAENIEG